jgi:hypothetical protein
MWINTVQRRFGGSNRCSWYSRSDSISSFRPCTRPARNLSTFGDLVFGSHDSDCGCHVLGRGRPTRVRFASTPDGDSPDTSPGIHRTASKMSLSLSRDWCIPAKENTIM